MSNLSKIPASQMRELMYDHQHYVSFLHALSWLIGKQPEAEMFTQEISGVIAYMERLKNLAMEPYKQEEG